MFGGRRCPRCPDDFEIHCSQSAYECAACGDVDYGEPGGPAHSECFKECPNEHVLDELKLQAQAPAGPPSQQDIP
jgi:hypothetical protein